MTTTARYGSMRASYSTHRSWRIGGCYLKLPNYKQQDWHSCGFVAALAVARYHGLRVTGRDVLAAVRSTVRWGINAPGLLEGLWTLGLPAYLRCDLTVAKLRRYVAQDTPVIVSVWPRNWDSDHWTVVQAVSHDRVYLSNYHSVTIKEFAREWSDMDMRGQGCSREGIVCPPIVEG
jgi:ABC-type bacteriocin/lantibiotic exporter with double-glycine peptidase domain